MSVYGDLEVPSLGIVVEYQHEAIVDADTAASLIESGNFVAVNRAGDDDAELAGGPNAAPATVTTPAPLGTTPAAGASPEPAPDTASTDPTTDSEEKNQ